MDASRRLLLAGALATGLKQGRAQTLRKIVRIGVLTDLSGQNSKTAGITSVACAQQAVVDFNPLQYGFDVQLVTGDHLNDVTIGFQIARGWFDHGEVDAISELNNSAIALKVSALATERNKVVLNTGAVSPDFFGKDCTPNLVDWSFDSWMLANSTGRSLVNSGGKSWFFVSPDYALGTAMVRDVSAVVQSSGGKVIGSSFYPFPGNISFYDSLLKARVSGAKIIGLAGSGDDLERCVKQANTFGFKYDGVRLAALVGLITNVKSLGLKEAEGLIITETFYWDLNDRTRAFTKRLVARAPAQYPNSEHAAQYSAVLHYLKAVAALGVDKAKASGAKTVSTMKSIPVDDDAFGPGQIRLDGRKIQPVFLFQVKNPQESNGEWDLYKVVGSIPAGLAYRPMTSGGCYLAGP